MDGVVCINKPRGMTSTRVVEKVRKKLKTKVGHTGTLDPIGTGMLLLTVGKATRFSWLFTNLKKGYRVKGVLGVITDTYDLDGTVMERREVTVGCKDIEKALEKFRGEIIQVPPPYSAKKVKGERAYRLARKGITPKLKPVKVRIFELKLLECSPPEFELYVKVSSGTYVRTLIHDIGHELSVGAALKELSREEIGPFKLEEAIELEEFLSSEDPEKYIVPVDEALSFLPGVSLDPFRGESVLRGKSVLLQECGKEGYVRIYINTRFVGVGELSGNVLSPERLLPQT